MDDPCGKDGHNAIAMLTVPNGTACSVSRLPVSTSQLGEDLELLACFLRRSTHFREGIESSNAGGRSALPFNITET